MVLANDELEECDDAKIPVDCEFFKIVSEEFDLFISKFELLSLSYLAAIFESPEFEEAGAPNESKRSLEALADKFGVRLPLLLTLDF